MDDSTTLDELQAEVAEIMLSPGTDYSPTNMMLALGHKIGNIQNFGKKRRMSKKGIGKDDVETGNAKVEIEIGQALWLLAGIAEANGLNLQKCRSAAEAHVISKQS